MIDKRTMVNVQRLDEDEAQILPTYKDLGT